jgi:hypothetical protein
MIVEKIDIMRLRLEIALLLIMFAYEHPRIFLRALKDTLKDQTKCR